MLKSRNQLRLDRKLQESKKPGTIQYEQAHRRVKRRGWMGDDTMSKPLQLVLSMLANRRSNMAKARVRKLG